MIETERARMEQVNRRARLRDRTFEFARIYLARGFPANEPTETEGPFSMPSWVDFEDNPQVKALLTEDDSNIPFTEDRYEQIEDLIAEGVIRYNIRARRDLAQMHGLVLPHWESEEDADENIVKPFLAKATTVFHIHVDCAATPGCLSYKMITEILNLSQMSQDPAAGGQPKWSTILRGITPDVLAGKIVRELLTVVGAPENSTWEQMEKTCGNKLVCTCRRPDFRQPASVTTLVSCWASSVSVVNFSDCLFRSNISDVNGCGPSHPKPSGEMKVQKTNRS